ncbi:protein-glutamate O-methyltransferase CheR [Candidatus Woesearchaeota archaeon]|nr:protein-glutamate O-methyltransferase CheR [Candidatus Woesearchaeota archaeon]
MREFEFTWDDFNHLRTLSFEHSGIRVPDDKFDMFYCRLAKRIRLLKLPDFKAYCRYLRQHHEEEFTEFINAITTNLTAFFRENHHFEYLRNQAIPDWKRRKFNQKRIRIWSAGCSTGEEPYSIAMTLAENGIYPGAWDVKILATDLDTQVLAKASSGIYTQDRLEGVSHERLRKWFQKHRSAQVNQVRIKPELKPLITFRQLNLITPWKLAGPFDVIFCRNVLIYFDNPTKSGIIHRFADLIPPEQHLIIGHSESLHNLCDRFTGLGNTIYRRNQESQ